MTATRTKGYAEQQLSQILQSLREQGLTIEKKTADLIKTAKKYDAQRHWDYRVIYELLSGRWEGFVVIEKERA